MGDKPATAGSGSTESTATGAQRVPETAGTESGTASGTASETGLAPKTGKRSDRRRARAEQKAAKRAAEVAGKGVDKGPGKGTGKGPKPGSAPKSTPAGTKGAPKEPSGPSEVPEQLVGLLWATHPRQALLTALVISGAALASGRPLREGLVAGAAVLVVQAILGLVNDVVDRERDLTAAVAGKPIAEGRLPAGNATFVATCLAIIAIPLSLQNGSAAAVALLGTLVAGLVSSLNLRRTALSWLPWAVGYGLLPAFLSYGGWGGGVHGGPPTWAMTGLAALLGIGVHFLTSLPHLVADNKTGVRHLPLRIALKIGAGPLLVVSGVFTGLVIIGILVAAFTVGLRQ